MASPSQEPESRAAEPGELVPSRVGRYRIIERIGSGAFAQVYLALEPGSGVPCALKVLRDGIEASIAEQVRVRFLAEQTITRSLTHPAVVRVRETSAMGESPCFLAMEHVEGKPFADYLLELDASRAALDEAERQQELLLDLARLGHQLAAALTEAHEKGIVHRDLKPDNVLVTETAGSGARVRILDFGIAKAPLELFPSFEASRVAALGTALGTVMGSLPYMAPEQNGAAHTVTGKADVFALGVMLALVAFRLDRHALERRDVQLTLPGDIDRLALGRTPLPEPWRLLLRRMVAHEPLERPPMQEVALCLQRLAQPLPELGNAVELWIRRGRLPSARRLAALLQMAEQLPELTPDEALFLKRAAAAKLQKTRSALGLAGFGFSLALGAAVVLAWPTLQTWPVAAVRARHVPPASPLATPVPAAAALVVGNTALDERRAKELETVSAALRLEQSRAQQLGRTNEQNLATIRSLNDKLAGCQQTSATARAQLEEANSSLEARAKQLQVCQTHADQADATATACEREVATKAQQLAETAERLRVCNRTLRQGSASPAEPEPGWSDGDS